MLNIKKQEKEKEGDRQLLGLWLSLCVLCIMAWIYVLFLIHCILPQEGVCLNAIAIICLSPFLATTIAVDCNAVCVWLGYYHYTTPSMRSSSPLFCVTALEILNGLGSAGSQFSVLLFTVHVSFFCCCWRDVPYFSLLHADKQNEIRQLVIVLTSFFCLFTKYWMKYTCIYISCKIIQLDIYYCENDHRFQEFI